MDRVQEFFQACFAREIADWRRVVETGKARGWIHGGAPAKTLVSNPRPAKKKPASKAGGRKGGR